jgi:predicted MFS family arabinose efflux permease
MNTVAPHPTPTPGPITTRHAVALFGLLLLAYSVNAMDRMVFPVLLPEVRAEYGMSLGAAGLQSTVFALGMGLAGVPAGLLLARFARKTLIAAGTATFSAATLLTVVSVGFSDMLVWRVLSGVGEALQLAAILTVAAGAFPRRRGVAIGAVNMAFAAGSVVGPTVAATLLDLHHSWRAPMIVFGGFGLLVTAAVVIVVPRRFSEATGGSDSSGHGQHIGGARSVLTWNPILLAVITLLFGLVDFAYIGLYATYLREHLGFSPGQAGLAVSLSGLAAFASPLGGMLTDRLDPRLCLGLLNLLTGASAAALFLGPATPSWQAAISFLFGLFASSGVYVALAGLLVKSVHHDIVGHASGVFITCIYLAASASGLLLSRFVNRLSWTTAGLVQIAGFSLAAALLALLLRPSQFSIVPPTRSEPR